LQSVELGSGQRCRLAHHFKVDRLHLILLLLLRLFRSGLIGSGLIGSGLIGSGLLWGFGGVRRGIIASLRGLSWRVSGFL